MKLRRYGQFINESVEVTDDLINLLVERGEFWDRLMNLDYSEFDFTASYSDMCKRGGRNPKADFLKIQKHFDQIGFTLEKLKDIFSEENNKKCGYNLYDLYKGSSYTINREPFKGIISEVKKKLVFPVGYSPEYDLIINPFSVGSSLDSQNAAVDVYLYFLFEELRVSGHGPVWLGGDGWGNVDLEYDDNGSYSEAFIRYRYGYHQTEYGKLWMEQCGVDEEWFQERAMQDLQKYLTDDFLDIIQRVDRSKDMTGLSFDNYSIIEEDRIIIDLSKLVEDIKKCPISRYWSGKKDYVVDEENIVAQFTKELEGFSLDIQLTDTDDLIIWGRFKED
jgi:hypothetical protein